MSRTNHHRDYKRWNMVEQRAVVHWRGGITWEEHPYGMEVWDLRFYAGCRRRPQTVHRVLDFHARYPWRFHYGQNGVAKSYADIRESEFRAAARRYMDEARLTYNAGGEVDEIGEPDNRPRSIEYDLW